MIIFLLHFSFLLNVGRLPFLLTVRTVCRSYGRAPKMIHLESNFVQFKEELLPKEGNKALLTFPFLHIYWTECCVSVRRAPVSEAGGALAGLGFSGTSTVFLCSRWCALHSGVPLSRPQPCVRPLAPVRSGPVRRPRAIGQPSPTAHARVP